MQLSPLPGPGEFILYAKALLENRGDVLSAASQLEQTPGASDRVVRVLKAAVSAGTTTGADWASALAPYQTIAAGFLESLRNVGAYDALLPATLQLPLNTRIVSIVSAATGSIVDEAAPKPVSQLSLLGHDMEVKKAVCIFVVSRELLSAPGTQNLLSRELQKAVAGATDTAFLADITAGLTPIVATADPIADIAAAVATLTLTAASRIYLIVPPSAAAALALMTGSGGNFLFPDLAPNGGSINGIQVVVSDAAGDQAVLVDAAQLATAGNGIALDASSQSLIEMSTAPDGSGNRLSLWQMNLTGLKAERLFAVKVIGSDGVVVISGVSAWGA